MKSITSILLAIRRNLSDDLLKPNYRNNQPSVVLSHTTGHCYVATEALYYLLTKKQQEQYKPHYLKIDDVFHQTITHWYLMTEDKKLILDPTYDQFPYMPNYALGKRAGFLTKNPSKRTITLLERIANGRRKNIHS